MEVFVSELWKYFATLETVQDLPRLCLSVWKMIVYIRIWDSVLPGNIFVFLLYFVQMTRVTAADEKLETLTVFQSWEQVLSMSLLEMWHKHYSFVAFL